MTGGYYSRAVKDMQPWAKNIVLDGNHYEDPHKTQDKKTDTSPGRFCKMTNVQLQCNKPPCIYLQSVKKTWAALYLAE